MSRYVLFYLAEPRFGGWVTYTAHLAHALVARGHEVQLHKVSSRNETTSRDFGRGIRYQNVTADGALAVAGMGQPIITACDRKGMDVARRLLTEAGAAIVIHDPTELKFGLGDVAKESSRVVVIRRKNVGNVREACGAEARFVPHPYVRMEQTKPQQRTAHAVSISRVDWDKNTVMLAQANQLLHPEHQIDIWGECNRMYAHHKLDEAFPDWKARFRGRFATELHGGARLAATARWCVDMSVIAGDGGGTQYTFLEAWDAGTGLIVHSKWCAGGAPTDDVRAGENALAVADVPELVAQLSRGAPPKHIIRGGWEQLQHHVPERVVPMFDALW